MDARDIRFTRNKSNSVIYAFLLGWPGQQASIEALGKASPHSPGRITNVGLLGTKARLTFQQDSQALQIQLPAHKLSSSAIVFKVELA